MFDDLEEQNGLLNDDVAHNLLQDLERSTSEEIRRKRRSFRVSIKATLHLQPGNASELLAYKAKGTVGDISEGGCNALFPIPVKVGDIYRLEFDQQDLDLPLTFAQCVRCCLISDGAYEAGFRFFSPISLPANLVAQADLAAR